MIRVTAASYTVRGRACNFRTRLAERAPGLPG